MVTSVCGGYYSDGHDEEGLQLIKPTSRQGS